MGLLVSCNNFLALGNFLVFQLPSLAVAFEINDFECHLLSNGTPNPKLHFDSQFCSRVAVPIM